MKGRNTYHCFIRGVSLLLCALLVAFATADRCNAEIAGEEAFLKIKWQYAFSVNPGPGGMQGFCVTSDRIIFIQNTSSFSTEPDKVYAYYLNDTDRYGNPVEQYSLAGMREDTDWEHGNGLTYNPVTNLVYVAFASNLSGDHQGCIGVMDPETLGMVDVIRLSDEYRVLGISYIKERNIYLVQAEAEVGFRFAFFDADFRLIEDLGVKSAEPGYTYQGMCVTEDYVLIPPCMREETSESYLNVFKLEKDSEAPVMTGINDLGLNGYRRVEAEGIAEIGDGRYMMNVFAVNSSGEKEYRFYTAEVPYYYTVTVISGAGGDSSTLLKVPRGEECVVPLTETEEFMLDGVTVDGEAHDRDSLGEEMSFTFNNVQSDHTIVLSMRSRYPDPVDSTGDETSGINRPSLVAAADAKDVYGEIQRAAFTEAVDEVLDRASAITVESTDQVAGALMKGERLTASAGKAAVRGFERGAVSVSKGIYRHRRILTRTFSTLFTLFALFFGLVFRVRFIRRRNLAYAKLIREKLKEEMDRVIRDTDLDEG